MNIDQFVPQYIPANLILWMFSLLSLCSRIPKKMIREHQDINENVWRANSPKICGENTLYIEHQNNLDGMSFGKHSERLSRHFLHGRVLTGRENTCEVSALYNAMLALSDPTYQNRYKNEKTDINESASETTIYEQVTFPALLAYFECHGIVMNGYFGTAPIALKKYLKKQGYVTKMLKGNRITYDSLSILEANNSGQNVAYIMTTFNDANRLSGMIHTMCITRGKGGYTIHNDYEGAKIYPTLTDAVFGYNKGLSKPILIMKVTKQGDCYGKKTNT